MRSLTWRTMEVLSHSTGLSNLERAIREACGLFRPPEDVTVSEWAIRNRVLPKGTTAFPGPFRPELFQIEMMDAILNPDVREIAVMKSTQVGYSDAVINNIIGYYVDVDPQPIMLVQPTI